MAASDRSREGAAGMAKIEARADFFGQVEIERLEWLPDPDFGLPQCCIHGPSQNGGWD